jgi:N-hydroxyarylamine O-acetyltransferase
VLKGIHRAHAEHIPFENLDILAGRPIRLDLPSVMAKLVDGRRGGYCFEHNTLLAAALETLGFTVTRLAARVCRPEGGTLPRTHALLRVSCPEGDWLADTGFGARGLLEPLPFVDGGRADTGPWSFHLEQRGALWALQSEEAGTRRDLYVFDLQPQLPVDMELANWYTSTHPDSLFRKLLVVHHVDATRRLSLRNRELTEDTGQGPQVHTLGSAREVEEVLRHRFGLPLPEGLDLESFQARSQ